MGGQKGSETALDGYIIPAELADTGKMVSHGTTPLGLRMESKQ
jgi:hypothetical protein